MQISWKVYLPALALLILLLLAGLVLSVLNRWQQGQTAQGVESTLAMLLTLHVYEDEIATRVAQALGGVGEEFVAQETGIATPRPEDGVVDDLELVLTSTPPLVLEGYLVYVSQPGDTAIALARRFDTQQGLLLSEEEIPASGFLNAGTVIYVPFDETAEDFTPAAIALPDASIVYGLLDSGFDVYAYVDQAGGYLSRYQEVVAGSTKSGAQIVQEVANMHSVSPKMLLALLEYQCGWVLADDPGMANNDYPIGYGISTHKGLYQELYIAGRELLKGYYGWREGSANQLRFADSTQRIHPAVNAGTSAVGHVVAGLYPKSAWGAVMYGQDSLPRIYAGMFGDPLAETAQRRSHLPDGLRQPDLVLPFLPGEDYFLTSGPHRAWGIGSPWAAIDFAPADGTRGCQTASYRITAAGSGVVVRSEPGIVVLDLDKDGDETTGWVLFYLHVAEKDRAQVGAQLNVDDLIGYASCEGGVATGTHVHFARKYNGEWMPAAGAIPMVLSGWVVEQGPREYSGQLRRSGALVVANPNPNQTARISRD
jgi:murein DD-endopeptidase MepM/ murein hydrolase activator NlpD